MKKDFTRFRILEVIILIIILVIIISQCNKNDEQRDYREINNIAEKIDIISENNVNDENITNNQIVNNDLQDENNINKSSVEIPILTEKDEQNIEEQETEAEGFEEQGIIAYNGAEKTPDIKLGKYAGLTYYSQIDSRWRNNIYSSVKNSAQTIGTSGCGPTSAAMVVSSIKGNITPDKMANLYTQYRLSFG